MITNYKIDKFVYCFTPQPTMPQRVAIFYKNLKNYTNNTFFMEIVIATKRQRHIVWYKWDSESKYKYRRKLLQKKLYKHIKTYEQCLMEIHRDTAMVDSEHGSRHRHKTQACSLYSVPLENLLRLVSWGDEMKKMKIICHLLVWSYSRIPYVRLQTGNLKDQNIFC